MALMRRLTVPATGFLVTTCLMTSPVAAAEVTIGGVTYSADSQNAGAGAMVVSSDPAVAGAVVIPAKVTIGDTEFAVTGIGDEAFAQRNLTAVEIPDTVHLIGRAAFSQNSLSAVDLPDSHSELVIANDAFSHNQLTNIDIPDGVTRIYRETFEDNDLQTVTLPESVKSIDTRAFASNSLTDVVIPSQVFGMYQMAFGENPNLTSVRFTGPEPIEFETPFTVNESLILYYPAQFGQPEKPNGYTTPTWYGYKSSPVSPPPPPVVTIAATDATASEAGPDAGEFTLFRTGPQDKRLSVSFHTSGVASEKRDYVELPNSVSIPAGSASVTVPVTPIDDEDIDEHESEPVIATLYPSDRYDLGDPSEATVTINDNEPPCTVTGTPGNDRLRAKAGDVVCARAGNDTITTAPGVQAIYGEFGNDTIRAGSGNDRIYGGHGDDKIYAGPGNDTVTGGVGSDLIYGQTGDDDIDGGEGDDNQNGGAGVDSLAGGAGNDTLHGSSGIDKLFGNDGFDSLNGGFNFDLCVGDASDRFINCETFS